MFTLKRENAVQHCIVLVNTAVMIRYQFSCSKIINTALTYYLKPLVICTQTNSAVTIHILKKQNI